MFSDGLGVEDGATIYTYRTDDISVATPLIDQSTLVSDKGLDLTQSLNLL